MQRLVTCPKMPGNISATFSFCRVLRSLHFRNGLNSLFSGSLFDFWAGAWSKVHWNKHTTSTELHGLGNQAVHLPAKSPRSKAVKKYLNDVMELGWHTGRAGSSGKKLHLYRENEDQGKAKIFLGRMLGVRDWERNWKKASQTCTGR